jgi:hypothetical protein
MIDLNAKTEIKIGNNKSFGIVFAIVFLVIALYPLVNGENVRIWAFVISFIFVSLAYFNPKSLSILNRLWFKFGLLLGSFIAPIVMGLVYFTTVLPTGLMMKLLRKDLLKTNKDKNAVTYWIDRDQSVTSMKNQF